MTYVPFPYLDMKQNLSLMEDDERYQTERKLWIMKNSPCQYTYFGTLVENVRETPNYKRLIAQIEIDGT